MFSTKYFIFGMYPILSSDPSFENHDFILNGDPPEQSAMQNNTKPQHAKTSSDIIIFQIFPNWNCWYGWLDCSESKSTTYPTVI